MIAAAAGLLVVALVLLLVGIAKSSVAPLVLSVVATLGACGLLSASWAYYRRAVASGDEAPRLAPWTRASNGHRPAGSVPSNWDTLDEHDAAALARTFGFDELQAVRSHEVTHGYRKDVLDAIDERMDEIVTTRRSVG